MSNVEMKFVLVNDFGRSYVEIPMSKYARNYFEKEYGAKGGYIQASMWNLFGTSIDLVAEKIRHRRVKLRRRDRHCKLKVLLPKELTYSGITEDSLLALGRNMDVVFRQQFLSFVRGAVATGCSDNFAVTRFLDLYKIQETDWSLDTAKRAWRFYKKRHLAVKEVYEPNLEEYF